MLELEEVTTIYELDVQERAIPPSTPVPDRPETTGPSPDEKE